MGRELEIRRGVSVTEYVACFSGNLSTFRQIPVEKDDGEEILSMNMIIIHNYYNTIGDTDKNSSRKNALLEI